MQISAQYDHRYLQNTWISLSSEPQIDPPSRARPSCSDSGSDLSHLARWLKFLPPSGTLSDLSFFLGRLSQNLRKNLGLSQKTDLSFFLKPGPDVVTEQKRYPNIKGTSSKCTKKLLLSMGITSNHGLYQTFKMNYSNWSNYFHIELCDSKFLQRLLNKSSYFRQQGSCPLLAWVLTHDCLGFPPNQVLYHVTWLLGPL